MLQTWPQSHRLHEGTYLNRTPQVRHNSSSGPLPNIDLKSREGADTETRASQRMNLSICHVPHFTSDPFPLCLCGLVVNSVSFATTTCTS